MPSVTPPPGALGLPFIGHTGAFLKDPFAFFAERHRQHGPVFRARILGDTIVCFVGPEAFTFFSDETLFTRAGASPPHFQEILHADALPFIDGDKHKARRSLLMNAFKPQALAGYVPIIQAVVERYLDKWSDGVERRGVDEFGAMAFAIADSLFAGADPAKDNAILAAHFDKVLAGVFAIPVNLPFSAFGKALVSRDALRAYISQTVDAYKPGTASHVLEQLVSARSPEGKALSKEEIKIETLHFFFAAYAGLQAALVNLVLALSQHPEVLERVRQEVARVSPTGQAGVTPTDVPYTDAVAREVRRYFPIVPTTFFAVAKQDCEFSGFQIKKGWKATAALHATMRDDATFPNADQFNPDRFSRGESALRPNSYVPHGGGPMTGHRCAGEALADQLINLFAVLALRTHSWELPKQDLTFKLAGLAPLPADGLRVVFRRNAAAQS